MTQTESRRIPHARSGRRSVPWPPGTFDLRRVEEVEAGQLLAPAIWETRYREGGEQLPWAEVLRAGSTFKVLGPTDKEWRRETRVPVILPTGELLYFTCNVSAFVRILLPPGVSDAQ